MHRYHDSGKKYDETMKLGNTTVNIIYPEPMTEAELERRVHHFCKAAWSIILNNEDDNN